MVFGKAKYHQRRRVEEKKGLPLSIHQPPTTKSSVAPVLYNSDGSGMGSHDTTHKSAKKCI